MHPQLQSIEREFATARSRFQRLMAATSDARWAKRPASDGWSVAECIAHLNFLLHAARVRRELDGDGLYRYITVDPSVAARAGKIAHQRDDDPVMVYEGEPI